MQGAGANWYPHVASSVHKRTVIMSALPYCVPIGLRLSCFYWMARGREALVGEKTDIWQGTLALMVLRTLETLGSLHGYGIARRIEQTSGDQLQLNYGTLYPALLKLEQEGFIRSKWGVSDNNRRAKYYELTRAGQRQVQKATIEWEQTTAILARFLAPATDA
jgi:PadR family transcriptional regulator PadR